MPKELVADAKDLLEMLETLLSSADQKEIPLSGVALTISQCKDLLNQHLSLAKPSLVRKPSAQTSGVTLADRIRTIPEPIEKNNPEIREIDINFDSEFQISDDDLESEEGRFYFS